MMFLAASLAGAVGAVCRYVIAGWAQDRFSSDFPIGTLIVNLAGSLGLGLGVGAGGLDSAVALAGLGFFGGFTTFSTLMIETIGLGVRSRRALLYLIVSVAGGIVMVAMGFTLTD